MGRGSPEPDDQLLGQDGKQKAQGKVKRRELVINKTGLKNVCNKIIHVKKEGPTRQSYGESPHTLSGTTAHGGPSLKHLYANTCCIGHEQE